MRLRVATILASLTILALTGVGSAAAGGQPFSADLLGANEIPGPGDPDGSGHATVTVNRGLGEVCWELHVEDIAQAVAAHIHVGDASVAGPVVVGLTPPDAQGASAGCTAVDRELARAIAKDPAGYYVNVHNAEFPAGALRGQLG